MAGQIDLNDLLAGLHSAVTTAQHLVENQHQDELDFFFEADGKPRMKVIQVPNMKPPDARKPGESEWVSAAIPLLTLVPIHTMKIKELKVRFKAQIGDLATGEKDAKGKLGRHRMMASIGGGSSWWPWGKKREDLAEIEIRFADTDPPEGIVRVNKELLKMVP